MEDTHKALVPVLGIPMLERNLIWLLALGFRELHLAISNADPNLYEFSQNRCHALASGFGATLEVIVETEPLGTIGACRACAAPGDLLVINVDNLTTLDVRAMLDSHRRERASMTIAVHHEVFRMPFGQVILQGPHIVKFLEKPEAKYLVSSGTYVLSSRAREHIPRARSIGVPELFDLIRDGGELTHAFPHNAPWIDVNDANAARRAELLIGNHFWEFECPWSNPDHERIVIILTNNEHILCSANSDEPCLGQSIPLGTQPVSIASRYVFQPRYIAAFDEAQCNGQVTRFHLFSATHAWPISKHAYWRPAKEVPLSGPSLYRCLAHFHNYYAREAGR